MFGANSLRWNRQLFCNNGSYFECRFRFHSGATQSNEFLISYGVRLFVRRDERKSAIQMSDSSYEPLDNKDCNCAENNHRDVPIEFHRFIASFE